MSLSKFEKFHRNIINPVTPVAGLKEILICWFVSFVSAPFLFTALFVIPIVGQMLFAAALILTLIKLYVRRSFKIFLAVITANLMFIIPTMITMQLVTIKNRFEPTLFFLIASCIPVSIFYILLVAARAWYLTELKYEPTRGRTARETDTRAANELREQKTLLRTNP